MTEARAVPPDFRLPWNATVTMADVWSEKPDLQKRVCLAPPRPRAKPESHTAKVPFAGRSDETFVLRDWQGSYLHSSCTGMTRNVGFAWKGSDRQLRKVREKFPSTEGLVASAIA